MEVGVRLSGAWARLASVVALACLVFAGTARAQSGTAALYGKVTDQSGAALPGVTVTITDPAAGITRSTVSDAEGGYQFLALPPGNYAVKAELTGFRTATRDKVELPVDVRTKMDLPMAIGQMSETVEVTSMVSPINTTDASLGNTISGNQIRTLPLEANNVVGLLSLQPGAVYLPHTLNTDPRSGSVSGSRADQSNVTLDGVDVNDPQFGTAYTSALRVTTDALQEFRVATSNYGADTGRSSAAQVSMVTKSGTNMFHGSGTYTERDTKFSSKEYFLGLSGQEKAKLDKKIGGGAVGGPIKKDKLFFFGNYERLQESSESPVNRAVPSDSMRDGVLIYGCSVASQCPGSSVQGFTSSHAVPAGFYGLGPAQLTAIDPLHLGPSKLVSDIFNKYPHSNDPGLDGYNIVGFRFASPIENEFNTYIGRVDYRATPSQSLFVRLNFQHDATADPQQFPGDAPRNTNKVGSRGYAIGHDWVLGSNKVNTFRYGYTNIVEDSIGLQTAPTVSFRFIDDINALTATSGRQTPTHNFVDDFSWIKGNHTLKFGTNLRFTRVPRYDNTFSFSSGTTNASWMDGLGRHYSPGNTCPGTEAACAQFPAVGKGFQATYADSFAPLLGIVSETDLSANYNVDGSVLAVGDPVKRRYGSDEYEFYVQDSWKVGSSLTVTGGLRYGLYSPPWEVNGQQVAPSVDLGTLLATRQSNMLAGIPDNTLPLVDFDLAGPANGKPGFYAWDKNNFAPRLAVAWSPHGEGGMWGKLTGGDKLVVRGGYSLVYDRIGQALATRFDQVGSFGLSTQLSSPVNSNNEDNPAIRFTGINDIPDTLPAAPPGGFPQTPPVGAGQITSALDSSITTPYSHVYNIVVGRELGGDYSFEAAYVGRTGRHQLIRRDLAMPLDFVDKKSGVDYFTAAKQMIDAMHAGDPLTIAPIPYWENVFPGAAGGGHTATQNMADLFSGNDPDWMTALWTADEGCDPACPATGAFTFFNQQWDSLAAQSSIGRSQYNALQITLRKRWSHGYQFDVNYTLAHSMDSGSAVETGSFFTTFDNGGYTGFAINTWNPDQQYANSDFDIRHQVNVNWVADLPFGHGKKFGHDSPGWVNAIIGEWSFAGLWRLTSGFPFNVFNCRSCWATNWNLQGNASLVTPGVLPPTGTTLDAVNGLPSPFLDPSTAPDFFRRDYPGESGIRNQLRGDGYFTIDTSFSKAWTMPWAKDQKLRFRWDIFNITNTPRMDVGNVTMFPDRANTFGTYNGSLASCDGGAGRCMQYAIRYEF
jgi:muramidase (phage lysozyme)